MATDQPVARIEYKWLSPWNPRAYAAPGTPGFGGYILAIAVSLVALGLESCAVDVIQNGSHAQVAGDMLLTLIFGFVPAAVIGSVGAAVVHLATWRASTQWPAILVAASVGFAFSLLSYGDFSGIVEFAVGLGVAAGVGRWAVVPLAVRRGCR